MASIAHYLDPELVTFLDVESRDETLWALVEVIDATARLENKDAFHHAILEREKIVSTGIGMGVAIPHAKLPTFERFFIAIGILRQGVDWDSVDSRPVRLVFMIGGPDNRQTEYLQILSGLTLAIKDERRRKKMLNFTSPEDIIKLFDGF